MSPITKRTHQACWRGCSVRNSLSDGMGGRDETVKNIQNRRTDNHTSFTKQSDVESSSTMSTNIATVVEGTKDLAISDERQRSPRHGRKLQQRSLKITRLSPNLSPSQLRSRSPSALQSPSHHHLADKHKQVITKQAQYQTGEQLSVTSKLK